MWEYNLTAILCLFAFAFLTWAISQRLEDSLETNDRLMAHLQKSNDNIQKAYEATLEGWSHALEIRDMETEGHTLRVTELALKMASRMGFSKKEMLDIQRGALLHDIGKLGIPDNILLKKGKLTPREYKIIQKHPEIAYKLIYPIEYLRSSLDIPRYHHEKWDGTGYPYKLSRDHIPLSARIFAIIDVYDALSSDRPYRKAWPRKKVIEYIKSESGRHFDPFIVNTFLDMLDEN
jgi:putative nucleotidyltransferase with HDIG domain